MQRAPLEFSLALFLGGLACSCSDREDDTQGDAAPPAREELRVVNVYSWDEYFYEEAVFTAFEEQTGIKVNYLKYDSSDEMLQKLKSNTREYDVVVMDDSPMKQAIALRLLRPLEHEKAPNVRRNNSPEYLDQTYDPKNQYSAPYMWGTTLLAFRKDMIPDPARSWKILFDPRYAGKISVLDERVECFSAALRSLGFDADSESPNELARATDQLVSLAQENRVKIGSDNDMKDHLRDARSWIAMMYSGDAALIADEAKEAGTDNIGFFIPEEGASIWIDSFVLSRDAQNIEEAHAFINFMADAKVAAESSNFLWYATPNREATPFLNPELSGDETIYPSKEVQARCSLLAEGSSERIKAMNEGWEKFINQLPQGEWSTNFDGDATPSEEPE